jgi:hypothetical protein
MSLLMLHTFGGHSARYARLAGEVAVHGITVEAFDFEGHGGSDGERRAVGAWHGLLDDVEDRLADLRAEFDGLPAALYGHGLGGLVAVDYLRSDRPRPDVAVLIAPSLDFGGRFAPWRLRLRPPVGPREVRLVDDPASLAVDRELGASWARDPLVDWSYPPGFVLEVLDAQRRVAAAREPLTLPLWVERAHEDAIAPQRRPTLFGQPGPDYRDGSGRRHDLPLDEGWRKRAEDLISWLVYMGQRHWPATSPQPVDWERYSRRTRSEAVAAFEAFVAGEQDRLARFTALVARLGGPPPGCDRESMARLGAWLIDALEWGDPGDEPPDWAADLGGTGDELSSDSLWLLDGFAAHYWACLREREPSLEWQLCTDRIDSYYPATRARAAARDAVHAGRLGPEAGTFGDAGPGVARPVVGRLGCVARACPQSTGGSRR